MIKPRCLTHGMTIGVVAPSSSVRNVEDIDTAVRVLESMDYKVKVGRHVRGRHGFLSGTDEERLKDLNGMLENPDIDAIMCVRGGFGASRIVEGVNFAAMTANPRIFIGFSDVTILNLAFLKRCKLINFNGPMAASTFGNGMASRFTVEGLLRTLTRAEPAGSIWQEHGDRDYLVLHKGQARGRLTGGNLSLMAASVGTPFEIRSKGQIVLIEEVGENPYRVDRMLTQLLAAGCLKDAAGIAIGRNVPHQEYEFAEVAAATRVRGRVVKPMPKRVPRDFEPGLNEVFAERLAGLNVPVLSNLPFGHIDEYATLPLGAMASLDTTTGDLVIEEAAVL